MFGSLYDNIETEWLQPRPYLSKTELPKALITELTPYPDFKCLINLSSKERNVAALAENAAELLQSQTVICRDGYLNGLLYTVFSVLFEMYYPHILDKNSSLSFYIFSAFVKFDKGIPAALAADKAHYELHTISDVNAIVRVPRNAVVCSWGSLPTIFGYTDHYSLSNHLSGSDVVPRVSSDFNQKAADWRYGVPETFTRFTFAVPHAAPVLPQDIAEHDYMVERLGGNALKLDNGFGFRFIVSAGFSENGVSITEWRGRSVSIDPKNPMADEYRRVFSRLGLKVK